MRGGLVRGGSLRSALPVCTLALVVGFAARGDAHGLRTAYLEVTVSEPGRALVHLRPSMPGAALAVRGDDGCTLDALGEPTLGTADGDRTWLLACADGFAGRALTLDGLGPVVSDAVAYVVVGDGTVVPYALRPDDARVPLATPSAPARSEVAAEFIGLGLVHIITGYDHLLFLLLIVLLMRDLRGVLLAETMFTLSHSLSFSATALGWIHVSSAAAEACIALSLVLLAAEIRLSDAPPPRWRGAAMALVFGLVHGLGFAGGLREIGLPDHAIGTALLGFACGIEIGQVAFLGLVLVVLHLVRRFVYLPRIQLGAIYAIGSLSAYWVFERALAL
jgi:hydrogenase/urease accessory protein HupE